MLSALPNQYLYWLSIIIPALISIYSVRKIIFITRKRKIFDIPDNVRKIHGAHIPSLGGIGVFIGYMATVPFFVANDFKGLHYIIISSVILFFTGVYDDIMNMRPSKKLIAQLLATAVTVFFADIRITSLYGLFGVTYLPEWFSIAFTIFCGTFFINVFNFIDGIDGLASMMSILYTAVFGTLLALNGNSNEAFIAFALLGATLGLLYFNYPPAKIYMGDTGSMLTGFSIFLLAVLFIRSSENIIWAKLDGASVLLLVTSVLFLPVFDALRVFLLRGMKGISPLKADRRHLHYYLLDAGLSHAVSAWLLIGINILTIGIAFLCIRLHVASLLLLVAISIPSVIISIAAGKLRKGPAL